MKAMTVSRPARIEGRPLKLVDLPCPEPGPGQLRIKVSACGVCHTDLHIAEGDIALPRLPTVPGHEIVGVVDALGEGVTRFPLGARVGVPWLHRSCGTCRHCAAGEENLCGSIELTGLHVDGGFAEWTLAEEDFAYAIPERFSDTEAAPLLCAGVVGYRALRRSGARPGHRLGLYGFGASAHIVLQIARAWDCEVFVFTRSEHHRRLARSLGAVWAKGTDEDPGALMDESIIFAPAGPLVPLALAGLEHGGTLVLGGIHMSDIPALPYDLLWHERTVASVANSTRQDVIDLLQVAAEIPIRSAVEPFRLEESNDVLSKLKAGKVNGAAVLRP